MPEDKYFKYQNFPTHFGLSLFLGLFLGLSVYIPYKFAQSSDIPPKIKWEI